MTARKNLCASFKTNKALRAVVPAAAAVSIVVAGHLKSAAAQTILYNTLDQPYTQNFDGLPDSSTVTLSTNGRGPYALSSTFAVFPVVTRHDSNDPAA